MGKAKLNNLVERMLQNAKRIRHSASSLNLSIGKNETSAEKLKSTADGIEIVVNAIKRERLL